MADIEKQQVSNNHPHPSIPAPGAGPGAGIPYTLGANPLQQQLFQGGIPTLRRFANPAPLGLLSFASTTLVLSLVNVQSTGVNTPNVVIGLALFVGGLAQLLAGMWEFAAGNTLGATAFSSYGGFWLSYATIFIPSSGILDAYSKNDQLGHAIGFYLAVWFIFTFIMLMAALRSNTGLILLFFMLDITFLLLTIAQFRTTNSVAVQKAGGAFGIVTAFIAYYCGASNMLTRESSFFTLPLLPIPAPKSD